MRNVKCCAIQYEIELSSFPAVNGLGCKLSVHLLLPFQTVTKVNLMLPHRL